MAGTDTKDKLVMVSGSLVVVSGRLILGPCDESGGGGGGGGTTLAAIVFNGTTYPYGGTWSYDTPLDYTYRSRYRDIVKIQATKNGSYNGQRCSFFIVFFDGYLFNGTWRSYRADGATPISFSMWYVPIYTDSDGNESWGTKVVQRSDYAGPGTDTSYITVTV